MSTIDIIIFAIVAAGLIVGLQKGLVKQVASITGLFVGIIAAKALYATVAEMICPVVTEDMTVAQVIAFVGIWIIVPFLFSIGAVIVSRALDIICLGWMNRLLGGLVGALKYVLLLSLVFCAIDFVDTNNVLISATAKQGSALYTPTKEVAGLIFPVAKRAAKSYIQKRQNSQSNQSTGKEVEND